MTRHKCIIKREVRVNARSAGLNRVVVRTRRAYYFTRRWAFRDQSEKLYLSRFRTPPSCSPFISNHLYQASSMIRLHTFSARAMLCVTTAIPEITLTALSSSSSQICKASAIQHRRGSHRRQGIASADRAPWRYRNAAAHRLKAQTASASSHQFSMPIS